MEYRFLLRWNLDTLEVEVPGKFWKVVPEKEGEDQLDQLCEKLSSVTKSRGGEEYPTYSKEKGD
jgi:hypothetical protein